MTFRTKTTRHANRKAFTLMEMLIVVAIIVILAGVGTVYLLPQLQKSKEGIAKTGAVSLSNAIKMYATDHDGSFPNDISALTQKDDRGGPYIKPEGLLDPWNKQYQVDPSGQHNNGAEPDVFTTSPDGKVIGNWKQ